MSAVTDGLSAPAPRERLGHPVIDGDGHVDNAIGF